jgi:hypothetical protein
MMIYKMCEAYSERFVNNFHSKYVKGQPDECWEWKSATDRDGYGRYAGKPAHRITLHLKTGRMGATALHSCDNRCCVNPQHLDWGTQGENMRQKAERGRAARNNKPRTPMDVIVLMREIYGDRQMSLQELAETFDLSYNQARQIVGNYSWIV